MGHFYTQTGESFHEILGKTTGKMRSTTIRDAKELKLVGSVTEINNILDKPFLVTWAVKQGINTAIEFPKKQDEVLKDYIDKILAINAKNQDKIKQKGSNIHKELENYFKCPEIHTTEEMISNDIRPAIYKLIDIFGCNHTWISEKSFAHKLGFGGCVDLHSRELNVVIDFKTKGQEILDKSSIYPEFGGQLAAYRLGLDLPTAACYNLIISTIDPSIVYLHKWSEEDLQKAERMFKLKLALWKEINTYDSSF